MNKVAVIGLGCGDEGKGVVTDFLSSQFFVPTDILVVRFGGGHQCGHTVTVDGVRHVFSNFGSGTMRGVATYWGERCTVSPTGIFNEYNVLKSKGIEPKLFIDRNCPIVTPYDKYYNVKDKRTKSDGTCGVGFGATIQREEDYFHLNYIDLFYPYIMDQKLYAIRDYYSKKIENDFIVDFTEFLEHCRFVTSKFAAVDKSIMDNKAVIFEGAQGIMLDQDIGFFPHVTRSNTGTKWIKEYDPICYLVTRAYQTRHGNGPMSNEGIPHNIMLNPDETNKQDEYQGRFRISLLDVDLLEYAIIKDNIDLSNAVLCMTCLDHIKNDCRFTYHGEIVECANAEEFVHKVGKILKISRIKEFIIENGNVKVSL